MAVTSPTTTGPAFVDLDDDVLRGLRAVLVAERATQMTLAEGNEATARELTGQRDVDSILEREIAEASAARARDAIADIDDALAEMASGTYGRCESCGAPIRPERLEVIPYARSCVTCSR
jgi:RNA polymerase-binding transcription factor DksA